MSQKPSSEIPDVAKNKTSYEIPLEEVGMDEVFVPVKVVTSSQQWEIGARARVSIDLIKPERGIHMSRLYLRCHELLSKDPLSHQVVRNILQSFIDSQEGLCATAYLNLRFELPLLRSALITDFKGWKSYPITIKSSLHQSAKQQSFQMSTTLEVDYSSTCPCSAALSRRYIRDKFLTEHKDAHSLTPEEVAQWIDTHGLSATPHGQRSRAFVHLTLDHSSFPLESLITTIEDALTTPTQTAVKRFDEQQFAVLSGQNVMFAEDAARRVAAALMDQSHIKDFDLSVHHYESLHSHDAFARTSKSAMLASK